jgi:hypothetical protein
MTNLILSRRGFLAGLSSLLATPAVVRAGALMPIKVWRPPLRWRDGYIVLTAPNSRSANFQTCSMRSAIISAAKGRLFASPYQAVPPVTKV